MMYIVVVDDNDVDTTTAIVKEDGTGNWKDSFRYTRPVLQSTLQLMGCKARHAFKVFSLFLLQILFFFFFNLFPTKHRFPRILILFLSCNGLRFNFI